MPLPATRWSRAASRLTLAAAVTFPTVIAVGGTAAAASRGQPGTAAAGASGGELRGWGQGNQGQLGDGHRTKLQPTPVQVRLAPGVRVTSVRAGCDYSLALTTKGSTTNRSTPIAAMLPAGARVTAVTAGCDDSYALTAKGHVLAWGYDAQGQLGDGGTTSRDTPVQVELPSGWRASALGAGPGAAHALAIGHRR
jgi:alpha-tubulin suppressor-like RCC1 family protein